MNDNIVINTKLETNEFLALTESIVDAYFDFDGEYQPHYGILEVFRLFFNLCVKDSPFNEQFPDGIKTIADVNVVIKNDELMQIFNEYIFGKHNVMDFGGAYHYAMMIVDNKRTSVVHYADMLKQLVTGFVNQISPLVNDDNLNKISMIAEQIGNGNIGADSIVEAYAKSDRFQTVINETLDTEKKDTTKKVTSKKRKTKTTANLEVAD